MNLSIVRRLAYKMSYRYTAAQVVEHLNESFDFETHYLNYDFKYNSLTIPLSIDNTFFIDRKVQPYLGLSIVGIFTSNYSGIEKRRIENSTTVTERRVDEHASTLVAGRLQFGVNFDLGSFLISGGGFFEYSASPIEFNSFSASQRISGLKLSVAYAILK